MAAATDIDAFYTSSVPRPATDDTLLVLSVDGKGVVMRPEALREETRKAAPPRVQAATGPGWPAARSRAASGWRPWEPSTTPPRRPHDVIGPGHQHHHHRSRR
jgi:hypothetical protein